MALNAYSGLRATTFRLKNVQTNELINLSTKITKVKPLLTTPFLLELISNNSITEGDTADFVNLRFYYTVKSQDTGTLISDESGTVVANPAALDTEELTVVAAQLAPRDVAKKLGFAGRDLKGEGLENVAATKLAGFLEQRRAVKSTQLFNMAILAAFSEQQKVKATSFKTGAHFVVEDLSSDPKVLYKSLKSALNAFKILGLENAVPKYNADIPMVLGVPETDMAILINLDCYAELLEMPGLFASDAGFKQFEKLNFKEFLGIPLIPVSNLPANVNFMIITTGTSGALHYSTCGDLSDSETPGAKKIGVNANLITQTGWSFDYRIDIVDRYRIGVVLPQLIFVSSLKEPVPSKSDLKNKTAKNLNSISDGINNNIKNIDEKILELKTKIDLYKNHIELNKEKLDKEKINKAKDAIAIFGKEITSLKNEKADLLTMFKKTNNKIESSLSKEEESKIISLEELSV